MKKPIPKTKTSYNYNECLDYIKTKYGYDPDNFANCKFTGKPDDPPFQNFWGYLCECMEIHNGCYIYFNTFWMDNAPEEWQKKIFKDFLTEFGEGIDQEIVFWVSW